MGRIIIIVLAVAGLLPLLGDAKALDATTVSGTIILGLGPPIFALMWVDGYRAPHLPPPLLVVSSSSCCVKT